MTDAIRAWRRTRNLPPTPQELHEAYEENAAHDAARREKFKSLFGFCPPKRWTSAQRKRAKGA